MVFCSCVQRLLLTCLLFLLPKVKPEIVTIGREKRRLRIIGWCGLSFPQDHRREWRFGFAVPKANLERFKWSQTPTSGYRPLVLSGTCGVTTHRLSWCIKAYINFLLPIQTWPWTFLGKEYTQLLWEELVLRPNFWVALAIEKKKAINKCTTPSIYHCFPNHKTSFQLLLIAIIINYSDFESLN